MGNSIKKVSVNVSIFFFSKKAPRLVSSPPGFARLVPSDYLCVFGVREDWD